MSFESATTEINLHQQAHTLIVPVPEPLSESVFEALHEAVLPALRDRSARRVVFDCSAVDSIDSQALQAWEQLISAVRLLGAQAACAAFRPHIAATIVTLGDFFATVVVTRSVERAIHLLRQQP